MGFELSGAALDERDEFTEKMTPALIGACRKSSDTSWCLEHEARWPVQMTVCRHARDMEAFADQLIEAWEGRVEREPGPVAAALIQSAGRVSGLEERSLLLAASRLVDQVLMASLRMERERDAALARLAEGVGWRDE